MKFADWRKAQGYTQQQVADQLGVSQPVISALEADDPQVRGRDFVLRIWRLTEGAVSPNDIYDLPPPGQPQLPLTAVGDAPLLAGAGDQ